MQNILVVDDEIEIWKICQRALEHQGYMVQTAENGEEALKLLSCVVFDLALVDLHMPRIDGIELLRRIKHSHPQTEVVIITAETTIEAAIQTLQMGAFDYITKPFNLTEIFAAIRRALEYARLKRSEAVFRETTYLYQLSQEMAHAPNKDAVLSFILERAASALKADAGSILTMSRDTHALRMISTFGASKNDPQTEIKIGERIAGWVAQNQRPLLIKDLKDHPQFRDLPIRFDIASSLIAPMTKHDITLGVICLNRMVGATAFQFTQRDIDSLQIFAAHAALILALQQQHLIFN